MSETTSVFNFMTGFDWNPDFDSSFALYSMFQSKYGTLIISPLTEQFLSDETQVLTVESSSRLASVLKFKYQTKWNRLWSSYTSELDPLATTNLTSAESGLETRSHSESSTDTTTYNTSQSHTGTDAMEYGRNENQSGTDTTTFGKKEETAYNSKNSRSFLGSYSDKVEGEDSGSNIRTGNQKESEGGNTKETVDRSGTNTVEVEHTGDVTDAGTSTGTDSVWGFNSSESIPSSASSASDGNKRSFNNSDKTTEKPLLKDTTDILHGKTSTTEYNNVKDELKSTTKTTTTRSYTDHSIEDTKSGKDTISNSGNDKTEYGKKLAYTGTDTRRKNLTDEKTGNDKLEREASNSDRIERSNNSTQTGFNIRRLTDKLELIDRLFNDPAYMGFFDTVLSDVAFELTCQVFV